MQLIVYEAICSRVLLQIRFISISNCHAEFRGTILVNRVVLMPSLKKYININSVRFFVSVCGDGNPLISLTFISSHRETVHTPMFGAVIPWCFSFRSIPLIKEYQQSGHVQMCRRCLRYRVSQLPCCCAFEQTRMHPKLLNSLVSDNPLLKVSNKS